LRDLSGKPVIATFDRLPEFPDMLVPDANKMDEAIQLAFNLRPEIKRLRFQQQTLEVELAWARNQQLPALNAILAARSDVGLGKPAVGPSRLDRNSLEVGFEFQVPWQRREAIGRAMAAQAQIVQIAQQLRQQEDEIRIEVQAGLSTLERSYQNFVVAEKRAKLALDVAEGERRLFDLGLSTIITVNLREQNAFDAQLELVGAKLNYFRLLADYKAALGIFDR
jgi:outer membrane protein TolC